MAEIGTYPPDDDALRQAAFDPFRQFVMRAVVSAARFCQKDERSGHPPHSHRLPKLGMSRRSTSAGRLLFRRSMTSSTKSSRLYALSSTVMQCDGERTPPHQSRRHFYAGRHAPAQRWATHGRPWPVSGTAALGDGRTAIVTESETTTPTAGKVPLAAHHRRTSPQYRPCAEMRMTGKSHALCN